MKATMLEESMPPLRNAERDVAAQSHRDRLVQQLAQSVGRLRLVADGLKHTSQ
jgi:hypothetical protein